MWKRKEKTIF